LIADRIKNGEKSTDRKSEDHSEHRGKDCSILGAESESKAERSGPIVPDTTYMLFGHVGWSSANEILLVVNPGYAMIK
jgi:hypothetical protein